MKITPYIIRLTIALIILVLSVCAILGLFYPISFLNIQFTALLQKIIVDFSVAAISIFAGIIVLTLLFGRFYCSMLCPFGILQEVAALFRGKRKNSPKPNFGFKYLVAGLTFGALIGGSALFIRYIDPYTIFGSAFSLTVLGIVITVAVFILALFTNRFFCTNICPVGAVLGLISKFSLKKMYIDKDLCVSCSACSNNCPSGCIDIENKSVDNEMCVKCLKCVSVCPKHAIKFGSQPISFNPKRREVLWGIGAIAVLAAGYSAGVHFAKNTIKKVKDVILPPGAKNAVSMANKCLNCNLCINNCPEKILQKADENIPFVHIDFSKGKKHCSFKCNKCSEVCPSGAIQKISLEQKQHTKIATAKITEDCAKCGLCYRICPAKAIEFNEEQGVLIDEQKCIGCGKCASICFHKAIQIFAVEEQSV